MEPLTKGVVIGLIAAVILVLILNYTKVLNVSAGEKMPSQLKNLLNKKEEKFINLFEQQNSLGITSTTPEAAYQKILGFD